MKTARVPSIVYDIGTGRTIEFGTPIDNFPVRSSTPPVRPKSAVSWNNTNTHPRIAHTYETQDVDQPLSVYHRHGLNNLPSNQTTIPKKIYRISENETINNIKNDITATFGNSESKVYRQLKQLTAHKLDPTTKQKMENIFQKLCIKKPRARSSKQNMGFEQVDVDYVSRMYIKSKSRQRQKNRELAVIKEDIRKTNKLGSKRQAADAFFQFSKDNIKNFQKDNGTHKIFSRRRCRDKKLLDLRPNIHEVVDRLTNPASKEKKSRLLKGEDIQNCSARKHRDTILAAPKHPIIQIFDKQSESLMNQFLGAGLDLMHNNILDDYFDEKIDNSETKNDRLQRLREIQQLNSYVKAIRGNAGGSKSCRSSKSYRQIDSRPQGFYLI